jgi:hypothetical protein
VSTGTATLMAVLSSATMKPGHGLYPRATQGPGESDGPGRSRGQAGIISDPATAAAAHAAAARLGTAPPSRLVRAAAEPTRPGLIFRRTHGRAAQSVNRVIGEPESSLQVLEMSRCFKSKLEFNFKLNLSNLNLNDEMSDCIHSNIKS